MHAATPSTFMTDERTRPNPFTRQSERPGGKQQLKHMFKQQWPLAEQAARCICLEFVLQLIREQRVQMRARESGNVHLSPRPLFPLTRGRAGTDHVAAAAETFSFNQNSR